jgi:hypothetical protein
MTDMVSVGGDLAQNTITFAVYRLFRLAAVFQLLFEGKLCPPHTLLRTKLWLSESEVCLAEENETETPGRPSGASRFGTILSAMRLPTPITDDPAYRANSSRKELPKCGTRV